MAIDAISNYGGLLNSYAFQSIKTVDVDTVKEQDKLREQEDKLVNSLDGLKQSYEMPYQVDNRSRSANLEDVSLTMQTGKDLDFLGRESGIEFLDMEKEISNLQRDAILQDYQYFVGSVNDVMYNNTEGVVLRK